MRVRRFAGVLLVLVCLFGAVTAQAAVKTNFSVSSVEKLETALKYEKKHKVTEFTVTMDAALYKKMTADDGYRLKRELMLCGAVSPGKYTQDDEARKISFSVRWSGDPVYQVTSKAELDEAVGKIVKKDTRQFTLVMGKTLYASMSGDEFAPFKVLIGRHCIASCEHTAYNDLHILKVTSCSIMRNAKYVTTMDEAVDHIRGMAAKEAKYMNLFCPASLYEKLRAEITWDEGETETRQKALLHSCGGRSFSTAHHDDTRHIGYSNVSYYPGFRIANAAAKGNEKQLPDEDLRTLAAARKLVKGLDTSKYKTGTAASKKAAAIVDALARVTEYKAGNLLPTDGDCARGPLLNGEGDCDGYADTFYLCASLAGLEVRYVSGPRHMWNMVRIDKEWYFVDATWCDAGTQSDFRYFMLGRDRASQTHVYFEDIIPALAGKTDPKLIP